MSDSLLVDLLRRVMMDLSSRWRAGKPRSVEEYLAEHPVLAANEAFVCELIRCEVEARLQAGVGVTPADYVRQFPHLAPRLVEQFTADPRFSPQPATDETQSIATTGSTVAFQQRWHRLDFGEADRLVWRL